MNAQPDLFSADNLASTVQIPKAPALVPHQWPFPGMTPEDSARAGIANSEEFRDMLATVIKSQGNAVLTSKQVNALIPADWRELCRSFTYCNLDFRCCEKRGIKME